jgi:alpha-1,3-rhamnosyl/mannosyltransferase
MGAGGGAGSGAREEGDGAAAGSAPVIRVGVNLCWLVPGVVGGSESLLIGWLRALADRGDAAGLPRAAITVFGPAALTEVHPWLGEAFTFRAAPVPGRAKPLRVATESSWLAWQRRRHRLDVMHHAGGVVPPVHGRGTVLTVHDIQPLDLPANFSAVKRRYLAALLPRSVQVADVITTTSRFVVRRLVERLGADPARCRVVAPVLARRQPVEPAEVARARARYHLPASYVLYPAIAYPHKNHDVLYAAMRLIVEGTGRPAGLDVPSCSGGKGPPVAGAGGPAEPPVHLVLTGGDGPLDRRLDQRAAAEGTAPFIHRLGRLPRGDFDALASGAAALVFPSTYEGFGMGAFDALAVGAPVLAADIEPLAEVVGAQGELLDPHDAAAWRDRILAVATSPGERRRLAAISRARAGSFDPEHSAGALLAAYAAAAHPGAPPASVTGERTEPGSEPAEPEPRP